MHPNSATLLLSSGLLLLAGCESDNEHATTAPPPSTYEMPQAPIQPGLTNAQATGPNATTPGQPSAATVRPPRARVVEHTVTTGESLWSLSRKYETTIGEIREANQLSNDLIRAGQKLKIPTSMPEGEPFAPPVPGAQTPAANPPTPPAIPPQASTRTTPDWTVTPPVTPPTGSNSEAPQYRIPEPVILPPPGG